MGTPARSSVGYGVHTSQIPHLNIHNDAEPLISQNAATLARVPQNQTQPNSAAFLRLPAKLIELILYQVDANTFASLVLLDSRWRRISQKTELYAHHLSRCPSFALNHNVLTGPFRPKDLDRFRAVFAQEVRRNLFEAYLRPRQRLVNLISVNANTSAALPRGEAFRFVFSPNGQTLLALSTSRIYVLDVSSKEITVRRELKTLRRPLSAAIVDDASVLAVLSTKHQVNIYGLAPDGIKHLQVLVMDQPPRTIAIAKEGTVLAVAYDSSVEVFSLAVNALSTDRRAVRCEAVDSLTFSEDGSMLLGSSQNFENPHTVVITAPYYTENDPSLSSKEIHSRLWTTQILFPNNSSTCHFASLLPSHSEGDAQWLIAYDHVLGTYRSVRTDDTRAGIVYFIGPKPRRGNVKYRPNIEPAATLSGDLITTGFDNDRVYIYGVPQKIDMAPDLSYVFDPESTDVPLTSATMNRTSLAVYSPPLSSTGSISTEEDDLVSKVDWRQSLFVKGKRITQIKGMSGMKWVETPAASSTTPSKRLVIVAPGGVDSFAKELGEEPMPVDGGRICIYDFDYSIVDGGSDEITVEVGDCEPELLPEHHGNIDVEVALERRRSVLHNRHAGNRTSLIRAATEGGPTSAYPPGWQAQAPNAAISPPERSRQYTRPSHNLSFESSLPNHPDASRRRPVQPLQPVQPSSRGGRQLTSYLLNTPSGQVVFHRQNQIPHESDADNWVPPPPPYRPTTDILLTPELRLSMLGTFSESHHRISSEQEPSLSLPPSRLSRSNTIPEEAEFALASNITDLTRSISFPRPSFRTRPLSESSLSTISDLSIYHRRRDTRGSRDSSAAADISSPVSPETSAAGTSRPQWSRRVTDPDFDSLSPSLRATLTHPASPLPTVVSPFGETPPLPAGPPQLPPQLQTRHRLGFQNGSISPTPTSSPKPITLSGNNLTNRLNYPTPPLPQGVMPSMSDVNADAPPAPPSAQPSEATPVTPEPDAPNLPQSPSTPTPAVSQPIRSARNPNTPQWPSRRKSISAAAQRLNPNRRSSRSGAPPASEPITHDFAEDPTSTPTPTSPDSPSRSRPHSQTQTQTQTQTSTSPHSSKSPSPHSRSFSLFSPFSTSSKHRHRRRRKRPSTYRDLASGQGGYGPHGAAPYPGSHPDVILSRQRRPKLNRLETIQSIASGASGAMRNGAGKAKRGSGEAVGTVRDRDGRCAVM